MNLSPDDPDSLSDVYVRDLQANVTSLESRATPGYARPKAATPTRTPLVPAYRTCDLPDRQHGGSLSFASCSNPQLASDTLTVGTADANLAPTSFVGFVQLTTIIGRPRCCDTDVKIQASLNNVRLKSDLSDYTGELQLRLPLHLTDRVNDVDKVQPGTTQDFTFPVTMQHHHHRQHHSRKQLRDHHGSQRGRARRGSPPMDSRVIWEVGQVDVYDGGPDGDVDTAAGNSLFATQGVFVP